MNRRDFNKLLAAGLIAPRFAGAFPRGGGGATLVPAASGNWAARSTAPGVLWAHDFSNSQNELNYFWRATEGDWSTVVSNPSGSTLANLPNPLTLNTTSLGTSKSIVSKIIGTQVTGYWNGSSTVTTIPAGGNYPSATPQTWVFSSVADFPDPAVIGSYQAFVGQITGYNKVEEAVWVTAVNYTNNQISLTRAAVNFTSDYGEGIAASYFLASPPSFSITSVSWSGGVVTGTISGTFSGTLGSAFYASISGYSPSGYNYSGAITVTGSNTFTYPFSNGGVNPGPATGTGTLTGNIVTLSFGMPPSGFWARPFGCFPGSSNGIGVDDIGITNKVGPYGTGNTFPTGRTWSTAANASTHANFREAYYGHPYYWNTAVNPSAPYKNWTPGDQPGNTRDNAFDGQEYFIQFRAKISADRLASTAQNTKMFYLCNTNQAGYYQQFFWDVGPQRYQEQPVQLQEGVGATSFGTYLSPNTCFGDSRAPDGGTLMANGVQQDGVGGGLPMQDDFPTSIWNSSTPFDAWCFPSDVWVTYLLHVIPGRDNAYPTPDGNQCYIQLSGTTGTFQLGETAYQGPNLGSATASGVIVYLDPTGQALIVVDPATPSPSSFATGIPVVGNTSGATGNCTKRSGEPLTPWPTDSSYLTTFELYVQMPGQASYSKILDATKGANAWRWFYGDNNYGQYYYNPPAFNGLWLTEFPNIYAAAGGQVAPPLTSTTIEFTQVLLSNQLPATADDSPEYVQQLTASTSEKFAQVMPLQNNSYYNATPTNGNTTWFTAAGAIWQTNPSLTGNGATGAVTKHLENMRNWSGGAGDSANHLLYIHGGGHAGSCYNGLIYFDFRGGAQPTGWTLLPGSETTGANAAAIQALITDGTPDESADGKPASVHTYGGCLLRPASSTFLRIGGSPPAGDNTNYVWTADLTNTNSSVNPWTVRNDSPPASLTEGGSCCYDPVTDRAFFYFEDSRAMFLDCATWTWSTATNFPSGGNESTIAYDSTRGRVIVIGGTSAQYQLANIDFATQTISGFTTFTTSGDACPQLTTPCQGIGVFYDATLDCYWLFGGGVGGVAFDHIYRMDAGTFAITAYALQDPTGAALTIPMSSTDSEGLYGLFCFMPDWRAIGVATEYNEPAYVIRLPGS